MAERKNRLKNERTKGKTGRYYKAKSAGNDTPDILFGAHTVLEALANPDRQFVRLMVTENAARRYREELTNTPIEAEQVNPGDVSRVTGPDAVHQGLVLLARPLASPSLTDIAERDGPIVVLDQITDPHNVGAIMRSCAAFAAAGLVMTSRHSPQASGVLAKSASGALEHVPIVRVTNLSSAIEELKAAGVQCIGLDSAADEVLERAIAPSLRTAIVLGAEGKGLRHKTREKCTVLARLEMPGAIASLNVSNAAVLALYIAARRGG